MKEPDPKLEKPTRLELREIWLAAVLEVKNPVSVRRMARALDLVWKDAPEIVDHWIEWLEIAEEEAESGEPVPAVAVYDEYLEAIASFGFAHLAESINADAEVARLIDRIVNDPVWLRRIQEKRQRAASDEGQTAERR